MAAKQAGAASAWKRALTPLFGLRRRARHPSTQALAMFLLRGLPSAIPPGALGRNHEEAAVDNDVVWERLLFLHPKRRLPPPSKYQPVWSRVFGTFEGQTFSDASGAHPRCRWRRRVSWAVLSQAANGDVLAKVSGPLVYPLQEVPAGELHAATVFLQHAEPGARL